MSGKSSFVILYDDYDDIYSFLHSADARFERALLAKKSHFLLGPRQTGKSSLVRHQLGEARVYNLLDTSVYLSLSQNPGRLAEEIHAHDPYIVIDEIQRLPSLLNEVHRLIEEKGARFLLTGFQRAQASYGPASNLLGGRARFKSLHPLTSRELGKDFHLERAVHREPVAIDLFFPMIRRLTWKLMREFIFSRKLSPKGQRVIFPHLAGFLK